MIDRGTAFMGGVIAVVFVAILALWSSATIVSAGEQGVVTRYGAIKNQTLDPGFHWVAPFVDEVTIFSTREEKIEVTATASSKDLQNVDTTVALNYHVDPANVNKLFQEIGKKYDEKLIQPSIQESIKAATSNYATSELVISRPQVKADVMKNLKARLDSRYIIIDDIAIVNFKFSDQFDRSIEAKIAAEQNALKAKQDLERVKLEADQKVATAQAEAESLRLQKDQISPELLQLRQIEMQSKAVDKWDGKLPTQMYPNATLPFLNLTK